MYNKLIIISYLRLSVSQLPQSNILLQSFIRHVINFTWLKFDKRYIFEILKDDCELLCKKIHKYVLLFKRTGYCKFGI